MIVWTRLSSASTMPHSCLVVIQGVVKGGVSGGASRPRASLVETLVRTARGSKALSWRQAQEAGLKWRVLGKL